MKRIKVAYVGWFSHDDTEFCEPYAVCDINEDKVNAWVAKHPGVKALTDWRALGDDPAVDAVVVSTPNWLHCEMAEWYLERGKHVFCEKPMGVNRAEVDRMLVAQRDSGKQLAMDFEMRVSSGMLRVKEICDSGELGALRGVEFIHHRGGWLAEGNGIWRTDPTRSGGLFFMEVCHEVDFLRFLLGEVREVQSFKMANVLPQYPETMPDNVVSHLWFEGGVVAHLLSHHGLSAHTAKPEEYADQGHDMQWVFYGDKGSMRLDCIANKILVTRQRPWPADGAGGARLEYDRTEVLDDPASCHDIEANRLAFLRAVAADRPHVQDAEDAWRTHLVCLAAEKSALTGNRRIEIDYTDPS